MRCHDAIDLPTIKQSARHPFALVEVLKLIKRTQREVMPHIEIGWPTFEVLILREGLISNETGTFIRECVNALGPAVLRVEAEPIRESALQACEHRVVVRIHVRGDDEHGIETRVRRRVNEVIGHYANQLMTCAPLITETGDEFERQIVLCIERICIDI